MIKSLQKFLFLAYLPHLVLMSVFAVSGSARGSGVMERFGTNSFMGAQILLFYMLVVTRLSEDIDMIWSYPNRFDWRIGRLKMNMMSWDKKVA